MCYSAQVRASYKRYAREFAYQTSGRKRFTRIE